MTLLALLTASSLLAQTPEAPGAKAPRLVANVGHSGFVPSLDVSRDGGYLATADSTTVRLWDAATGAELRELAGARVVSFAPNGDRLMTGSAEGGALMWDIASGALLRRLPAGDVQTIAFSGDGRRAATGGEDSTILVWDLERFDVERRFRVSGRGVSSVAFSPDGGLLAGGVGQRSDFGGTDYPSPAILWDIESGNVVHSLQHDNEVTSVSFSSDGRLLLTASEDGTVRVWDVQSGQERARFSGLPERRTRTVFDAAFSPAGDAVLVATSREVYLWRWRSGAEAARLISRRRGWAASFFPDGSPVVGGSFGEVLRWEASGSARQPPRRFGGQSSIVFSVALTRDGRTLLTGGANAALWSAQTGAELRRIEGARVAVSPDGTLLLTGGGTSVRLWDMATGAELESFEIEQGFGISSVTFSPDGNLALVATGETGRGTAGDARLWNVRDWDEVRRFDGHRRALSDAVFSPSGDYVLTGSVDRSAILWDTATGRTIHTLVHGEQVDAVAFSPDERWVATAGTFPDPGSVRIWDRSSGEEVRRISVPDVISLVFSPDGTELLSGTRAGVIQVWGVATGREVRRLDGHTAYVNEMTFTPDGRHVVTCSHDSTTRIWDARSGEERARMISFRDGSWAVVDADGRFDASNGGDVQGLHWVVGLETIELSQLKDRYYEPRLLAKVLGFDREAMIDVEAFEDRVPDLFPRVELEPPTSGDPRLRVHLTNQGGGIGRVQIWLNNKEIAGDARGASPDPLADELTLTVDLDNAYLVPGEDNVIEVRAYNADGYLSSRGFRAIYEAPGVTTEPPQLWGVLVGVSDYAGDDLDLRFAAKDAAVMSRALRLGASRLFGEAHVHLEVLTTEDVVGAKAPTRANLAAAFERIASRAKSTDILVVYLAGHGVTHGGVQGDYYYLTAEASNGSLDDPVVRETRAVSSTQLTEWITAVPALKQVLVLDTCQAGRVVDAITEDRNVSTSQVRALERLKDRTGLFVLAGSAADAVSYEASRFGQGLLTYSLLLGMRGAALRQEEFVDVGVLFAHAVDNVPRLAQDIGGIQRPLLTMPRGAQPFDVGQLTAADREQIPLPSPKPFVLRGNFQDDERLVDQLQLAPLVNSALRDAAASPEAPFEFLEASELPGAYTLAGRYRVEGTTVTVVAALSNVDGSRRLEVSGDTSDLRALAATIVASVERELGR